jgi:hypothetical protein
MSIAAFLRGLLRKLTPPGNRGSFDSEYRQPNGQATHVGSPAPPTER